MHIYYALNTSCRNARLQKKIIDIVEEGATDEEIIAFIEQNYRLVLLNTEETSMLNLKNRSRISPDRLGEAGIVMYQGSA